MDLRSHFFIEDHRLSNGLRLILHRDSSLPLVAINLWYHVGSKNERPGRTGFAHLFEHMLFQGSEHVPSNGHFRYVQQVGGVANGSTWYDRTNYYETLPAHHLELGLWLESDRMGFLLPAMTEEKLENQREVVMNERRQRVDNQPYGRASERLWELLYPEDFPYHWPVIGYMEDIAAATLEDVASFFETHYRPNNAVLTVAGDFEPGAAREMVERYFGVLPPGEDPPRVRPPLPPMTSERRESLEDRIQLPRLYFAYRAPAYGEEEWYAGDLLASVLTGGKSSRLYHELVYRRQLAQSVSCHLYPTEICGTFLLVCTARPETDLERLEEDLLDRLAEVARDGVREDELERTKNRFLTAHFGGLQTLDRRADLLSQCATYLDEPGRFLDHAEIYRALEAEDLQSFARRYLRREARAAVRVLPEKA